MADYKILKKLISDTNKSIVEPVKNAYDSASNWLDEKEQEQENFYKKQELSPEARQFAMDVAGSSPAMGIISPGGYKTVASGLRELHKPTVGDMINMIEEVQPASYKIGRTIKDRKNDISDVATLALKEKGLRTDRDVLEEMIGMDAKRVFLPEGSGGFYDPQTRLPYLSKKSTRNIAHHEALHALENAIKQGKLLDHVNSSIYDNLLEPDVQKQIPGFLDSLSKFGIDSQEKLLELYNRNPDVVKKLGEMNLESMPKEKALELLEQKHFISPTEGSDPGRVLDLIIKPDLSSYGNQSKELYRQFYESPGRLQGEEAYKRLNKILKSRY